jgi:glycosyltransferase involved in cell wall biosynthesis
MVVHGSYPLGEPRVAREARAAVEAGWSVDVVAHGLQGEAAEESVDEAHVLRLPYEHERGASFAGLFREYFGFTFAAGRRVAALDRAERYDVVQIHNPPDFLIFAGGVPKLRGAALIFDIHDFAPELFELRYGSRPVGALLTKLLRAMEALATRLADAVITVHEPYRRELISKGVPGRKAIVVMNSVDEAVLPGSVGASADATAAPFRIVYHGTLTPHYGVEGVVDAFAAIADRIPDATLEIYGTGDSARAVQRRVQDLAVHGRVTTIDRVLPHRDVLRAIQGAAIGVVANLPVERNKAALPTKLLEYVVLGIPVVAANLPAIVEHFSPDEMRFFEAGDPGSLAEAIEEVASDRNGAHERAQKALARYDNYRWPRYAERYVRLLNELATRRSVRREMPSDNYTS